MHEDFGSGHSPSLQARVDVSRPGILDVVTSSSQKQTEKPKKAALYFSCPRCVFIVSACVRLRFDDCGRPLPNHEHFILCVHDHGRKQHVFLFFSFFAFMPGVPLYMYFSCSAGVFILFARVHPCPFRAKRASWPTSAAGSLANKAFFGRSYIRKQSVRGTVRCWVRRNLQETGAIEKEKKRTNALDGFDLV